MAADSGLEKCYLDGCREFLYSHSVMYCVSLQKCPQTFELLKKLLMKSRDVMLHSLAETQLPLTSTTIGGNNYLVRRSKIIF